MNYQELLYSKRKIDLRGDHSIKDILTTQKRIIKLDKKKSLEPILLQISGQNTAISETMVIYDLLQMIKSKVITIGAGGLSGINGLLFLSGKERIAFPNMWIKPYWPKKDDFAFFDDEDEDFSLSIPSSTNDEAFLNVLDEHLTHLFAKHLKLTHATYKDLANSKHVFLVDELFSMGLIEKVLNKNETAWYEDLIKN